MVDDRRELIPITDDELETRMSVILAAYSERFPQLRGKTVRPDLRDGNRKAFVRLLIEKLKQCNVVFFRRPAGDDGSGNSKWFGRRWR